MTDQQPRFEIFLDGVQDWRWRLRAANNEIIATSGESFDSKANAIRAVGTVKRLSVDALAEIDGEPEVQGGGE